MDTSITHIRPRFEFTVPFPPGEVMERIAGLKEKARGQVVGTIIDDHIILDIPASDRHYWSPQLNFRVEADELNPEHSVVRGLIGPRPTVWTMFMFIYFSVGTLGFFVASFGFIKWRMGEFSYFTLALPLAIIFMLTAYRTGKYGERLGADQIEVLKQFVRDALNMEKPQNAN
jgi:hypothetical protein